MKKIGIIGAGQAGQRIAVGLSTFDDVKIVGIVDPNNGRSILSDSNSPWAIPDVKFFDSDDEMLSESYDAIVLAADPINVAYEPLERLGKIMLLTQKHVTCPILWERPLGFLPEHPKKAFEQVPSRYQSIISFARYGLPTKAAKSLLSSYSLGDITDFEFFITLNCGLREKTWRQAGQTGVTQPIHFLDNAFEQIETMGLGRIASISAKRTDVTREGVNFDEKWELNIVLDNGISGRIIGLQYIGNSEFLYGLRSLRITGTSGALYSSFGRTCYIDQIGIEHPISLASYGIDPRIVLASNKLEKFFHSIDHYPEKAHCKGEAQALAECLRTWVDSLHSRENMSIFNLTTHIDASRYLGLAEMALQSALTGDSVSTVHLYER